MSKKPDGGPAFPRPIGEYKIVGAGEYSSEQTGMSLRDWFAGKELTAIGMGSDRLAARCVENESLADGMVTEIARLCYKVADAMIAESKKEAADG